MDTAEVAQLLRGHSVGKQAQWLAEFNYFHWPNDFPWPEPAGSELMTDREKHSHPEWRSAYYCLEASVPERERDLALKQWREANY